MCATNQGDETIRFAAPLRDGSSLDTDSGPGCVDTPERLLLYFHNNQRQRRIFRIVLNTVPRVGRSQELFLD